MELTKIAGIFEKGKGSFYTRGWVKRKRELKNKMFILLRDETDELQCVLDKDKADKKLVDVVEKATIESSIELKGSLRKDERAPNGFELDIEDLKIVGLADTFPIGRDLSEEFLLDVRHLWIRSSKISNALKVRATVFEAFREFMKENNFTETSGPMFVSGSVEGGSTLFKVPYFDKTVYLTQSSQFYLEVMMYSLGNCYTIAPSFRAEKSRTPRHLTEFWHAEAEMPWAGLEDIIDLEERMLKYMVEKVVTDREKELVRLGRDPKTLEPSINKKFHRMTYEEAVKEISKKFSYVKSGFDLGEKEEREFTKDLDRPIILTHYPTSLKPFYHRADPKDPMHVLCNDILAPEGYGEIIGSGERCWNTEELIERIKKDKLPLEPYQWYIDLRKYGSVPHAGFGMGLERFTSWLCKAQTIRDVVPIPRTITRTYP
ncbi:MAG: asparagine--tRNA ligase [Candidatus Diapherotrites archaeon CG08_land_8_20_14_0_20_34_12]|nr:MAG: asparagine--tRNA ligase [Candidatus Diapherotrites archaeon CG08_land_8_20_14_0_20_34_12]